VVIFEISYKLPLVVCQRQTADKFDNPDSLDQLKDVNLSLQSIDGTIMRSDTLDTIFTYAIAATTDAL